MASRATYIGVDVGAQKTMVVSASGQIVRNELGGIGTATLVSFGGRERHIGEAAVPQQTANPKNTIQHLPRLCGRSLTDARADSHLSKYHMFDLTTDPEGNLAVQVAGGDQGVQTLPAHVVLAMFLSKLRTYRLEEGEDITNVGYSVAVSRGLGETHMQEVYDAARIAGLPDVVITTSVDALFTAYRQKHPPKEIAAGSSRVFLICDMGLAQTTIVLGSMDADGRINLLAEEQDLQLGAAAFDHTLFEHFNAYLQNKFGSSVTAGEKKALRLMKAVEKIRKTLSTISDAHVQVENVVEGRDVDLHLTREELVTVAGEEIARFRELVARVLQKAGVSAEQLAAVEISGGAMRMPVLQGALQDVTGFTRPLGLKLDDAAIAYGAALLRARGLVEEGKAREELKTEVAPQEEDAMDVDGAQKAKPWSPLAFRGPGKRSEDEIAALVAEEEKRRAQDAEIQALAEVKNAIEAFILQMRGASGSKHGNLIDRSKLDPLIDSLENWLYSDDADVASLKDAKAKLEATEKEVQGICQAYFATVEKDKQEYERMLNEEALKAEAERQAAGEDDEDHDNRKLKYPDRMRLVEKNKAEGNELFQGGNYRQAAARYVRALTHSTKFFDMSPEQTEETNKVKLSLYSNLAQCYLKLENFDAAVKNCNEALAIDASHAKCLYRRAYAFEAQKKYEESLKDLQKAAEVAPEDKLVITLTKRVTTLIQREKEKEKKLWGKAFAS